MPSYPGGGSYKRALANDEIKGSGSELYDEQRIELRRGFIIYDQNLDISGCFPHSSGKGVKLTTHVH